ncbi:right-handed parallel beta-helix repeat-containing protein [Gaetbulibacter aestuarii]|uniref:Right-handed parallel beta-helix repeat-containing protein n=1 Tax=Gaetbulibacter aestuarii TaxID=1502358 RepID=A0ABW7N1K5_9FLAO
MIKSHFAFIVALLFSFFTEAQYQFSLPDNFRKQRDLPLVEMPISMNVNLRDFGALPNDGENDAPGIMKALNFCKKIARTGATGIKLVFEKGRYDLFGDSDPKKTHIIYLGNAKNLTIDGNGAEIIIHDPLKGFFSVFKSENIIVKNFFIDYDPLPFTQGKITGVNIKDKYFELKIDEGFPSLSESMFQEASRVWGMLMDPEIPGKLKDGSPNLFATKEFEQLAPGHFKVKLKSINLLKTMEIGDLYVHLARTNGCSIFKSGESKNITYLENTNYSSAAGSYNAFNMEEWNIIGGQVLLKPGRIHSANADCIHVNGGKFGPWIQNCLFEGYSDDAINMKANKRNILKQLSPTELVVKFNVSKGDILRIYNPREGKLIGNYEIVSSKPLGKGMMQVTLPEPINETLDVGDTKTNDVAYLDTESNESFVIRNNTFRNARRYGILLQNSFGVIERNIFENLSQSAITLVNGVDWGEGFIAHNITINQNIFKNCGYDATYLSDYNAAAIKMRVTKLKNLDAKGKWNGVATAPWKGLENIVISNNTFLYNKRALSIECSANTVVKGNKFIRNQKDLSGENEILLESNNTNLVFEN